MTPSPSSATLAHKNVHFLACIHGMWGTPAHLKVVEETIIERFSKTNGDTILETLRISTNANSRTYDGLDWGAERAVKEIYDKIAVLEADGVTKVTKFSIFGYSLGGLISRYAIGILYQRGFFRTVQPVNFTTFATPHLGLPRFRGFIGAIMHKLGPIMLSRTGKQFYGTDSDIWSPGDEEGRPLLEVMADKDSVFFKALKSFPKITFYGNAVYDLTVTYCSALAEAHDPFTVLDAKSHRLAIKLDPKYKHVIQSFEEVPVGEEVPLSELEKERKARIDALPWYSPTRYRTRRELLPPILQFPFPLNLLLYMMIPILLPAGLTYTTIRFQSESLSSRRRLKALAHSPEAESSLSAILRTMENAVADMIDSADPGVASEWEVDDMEARTIVTEGKPHDDDVRRRKAGRSGTPEPDQQARNLPTLPPEPEHKSQCKYNTDDSRQPILTPANMVMIEALNSIPQLRKVRAYFPYVRNSHSVIIVRDPKTFPVHLDGMGVVSHWADHFVL